MGREVDVRCQRWVPDTASNNCAACGQPSEVHEDHEARMAALRRIAEGGLRNRVAREGAEP